MKTAKECQDLLIVLSGGMCIASDAFVRFEADRSRLVRKGKAKDIPPKKLTKIEREIFLRIKHAAETILEN